MSFGTATAAPVSAISLRDVTLGYDRHPAVHHLTAEIPAGALLAVVGPNGGGKSTLLKGIAGTLRPMGGHVVLASSRHEIAWLPQQAEIDRSFPMTVAEMAAMGLWRRAGALRGIGADGRARVAAALARVGLTGFETRTFDTLSGGQLQRALFARLIVQDAPIMLLDEPFAAVDQKTSADLLEVICGWQREGRTVVAVLHDFAMVRQHFPDTLLLARELIAAGPTAEVMQPGPLAAAQAMSEAWNDHADFCARP